MNLNFKLILIAVTITLFSFNTKAQTTYYYGYVVTTSPDELSPYGPAKKSLVKRVVDKENKLITEYVLQNGKAFDAQLTQTKNASVFKVEDKQKTFAGTITFAGKDWQWDKWTYDITMSDSKSKIVGDGTLSSKGIETIKYVVLPDGTKQVKIRETLEEIDEAKYQQLLKKSAVQMQE